MNGNRRVPDGTCLSPMWRDGYNDPCNPTGWLTPKEDGDVTQIIAAICGQGKSASVVTASERSAGVPLRIPTVTIHRPKYEILSKTTIGMLTGDNTDVRLLKGLAAEIDGKWFPPWHVADRLRDAHAAQRKLRAERKVLQMLTDFKSVSELKAAGIPNSDFERRYISEVMDKVADHTMATTFIVAGVDDDGGHIFQIGWHSNLLHRDSEGYAVDGSGFQASSYVMSRYGQSADRDVDTTKLVLYEAIRAAMSLGGVPEGPVDMTVIDAKEITIVSESEVEALRCVWEERRDWTSDVKRLRELRETIREEEANDPEGL